MLHSSALTWIKSRTIFKWDNIYAQPHIKPELCIKTHYEGLDIAQSNRIHYLCFRLDKELPLETDTILKSHLHEPATDRG